MMKASIRIMPDDGAQTLARALTPETDDEVSRTTIQVSENNGELHLIIEAGDIVALRAAINSYLRWTKLALDARETIGVIQ